MRTAKHKILRQASRDALARAETPEGTTEAATAPSILEHGHADNDTDTEKAELIAGYVVTCMRRGPASTFHFTFLFHHSYSFEIRDGPKSRRRGTGTCNVDAGPRRKHVTT